MTHFFVLPLVIFFVLINPAQSQDLKDPNKDIERAKELYQNGASLYEEGNYQGAITAWQQALHLSDRPTLMLNISSAQERLGMLSEALETLNAYRAYASAEERDKLNARARNLELRIEKEKGELKAAEAAAAEAAAAEAAAAAAAAAAQQASTSPTTTILPTGEQDLMDMPPAVKPKGRSKTLPIVLFSTGGAFLVNGVVMSVLASNAKSDAEALCVSQGSGLYCPEEADSALSRQKTFAALADASYVVGALGVVGGIVTLVLPKSKKNTQLGVSHLPSGGALVRLSGEF